MKKVMGIFALMVVALTVTPAAADFYVIAGGGRLGTQISSVPYTISSPGLYYLAKNLTHTDIHSTATITVSASDVTLDLMGFCLTGPGKDVLGNATGVKVSGSNVEIRNGSIQDFGKWGISVEGGNGTRLVGLRVRKTGQDGIGLMGDTHLVMDCSVIDTGGHGIWCLAIASLIKGNHVSYNTGDGINVSAGCTVEGNLTAANTGGIYVLDGCTVTLNTAYSNTGTGIVTGNDCTITNNTTDGLTNGTNCTLAYNTVTSIPEP